MDTILYFLLALAYLGLFVWGIVLDKRFGRVSVANVLFIVILALLYDNAILAGGRYIGEGNVLERLNQARYWMHALITPLLVLFAWRTLVQANLQWFNKKSVRWLFVIITLGLIVFELVTEVWGLSLEPSWKHGVLSYKKSSDTGIPPVMIIGVTSVLLVASIIVWWKQKWPWFFAGVLAMGLVPLLHLLVKSEALHNVAEFLLMLALLATKVYQDKRNYKN